MIVVNIADPQFGRRQKITVVYPGSVYCGREGVVHHGRLSFMVTSLDVGRCITPKAVWVYNVHISADPDNVSEILKHEAGVDFFEHELEAIAEPEAAQP